DGTVAGCDHARRSRAARATRSNRRRAERRDAELIAKARAERSTRKSLARAPRARLRGSDPAASYSPTWRPCSTIGAGGLNGRVRDGTGCFPSAITAGRRATTRTGFVRREQARGSSPHAKIYGQAARPFSTGQLHALQRFHTRPINLVVFEGPSGALRPGDASSQGGLPAYMLSAVIPSAHSYPAVRLAPQPDH